MENSLTEILPGLSVMRVAKSEFVGVYPPNVYLVVGKSGACLIDTGHNKVRELRARDSLLRELVHTSISHIVLTHRHPDHIGGAQHFQASTGSVILASGAEVPAISKALKDDNLCRPVTHGEILDLGGKTLEFIHTPGHTRGSMCIFLQEDGVLFTGDTILGVGTTVINPNDEGDMTDYLNSLRSLLKYDLQLLCPGHGPVVRAPYAKIEGLIDHRIQRERQLLESLTGTPLGLEALRETLYPELDKRLYRSAKMQIRAHLAKLLRANLVQRRRGRPTTYTKIP